MSYLLFPAYLLMFSSLLYFLSAKNYIRVNRNTAVASFLLKVTLGCFYGYIFLHYYHGDDTWKYYFQSLDETALLKSDPLRFFTSLFDLNNETRYSSLFESVGSFWKELEFFPEFLGWILFLPTFFQRFPEIRKVDGVGFLLFYSPCLLDQRNT